VGHNAQSCRANALVFEATSKKKAKIANLPEKNKPLAPVLGVTGFSPSTWGVRTTHQCLHFGRFAAQKLISCGFLDKNGCCTIAASKQLQAASSFIPLATGNKLSGCRTYQNVHCGWVLTPSVGAMHHY